MNSQAGLPNSGLGPADTDPPSPYQVFTKIGAYKPVLWADAGSAEGPADT
jgi:hypothetical protein